MGSGMTAHPNRNWRRVMHDAALAFLDRYRWPADGVQVMTPDQLRELLREAYTTGYMAGRDSCAPGKPT